MVAAKNIRYLRINTRIDEPGRLETRGSQKVRQLKRLSIHAYRHAKAFHREKSVTFSNYIKEDLGMDC